MAQKSWRLWGLLGGALTFGSCTAGDLDRNRREPGSPTALDAPAAVAVGPSLKSPPQSGDVLEVGEDCLEFGGTETCYYVSRDGDNSNPGTLAKPWRLTKLATPEAVPAGRTVVLRGGWYIGSFKIVQQGTQAARITVTNYPGEAVILDRRRATPASTLEFGTLLLQDARYIDVKENSTGTFRVTNTAGERFLPTTAARPSGIAMAGCIDCRIQNVRINDVGNNAPDAGSVGGGFYGVILNNTGWDSSDRGHGHDFYAQNPATPVEPKKEILHSLLLNGYGVGVHIFGGSDDRPNNTRVEDNFIIQKSSASSQPGKQASSLAYGDVHYTTTGTVWRRNVITKSFPNSGEPKGLVLSLGAPDGWPGTQHHPGNGPIYNGTVVVENNLLYGIVSFGSRFVGGTVPPSADPTGRAGITFSGNMIVGRAGGFQPNRAHGEAWTQFASTNPQADYDSFNAQFPNNTIYDSRSAGWIHYEAGTQIRVDPNPYETGRGHIFIGNTAGAGTVNVNVSPICTNGQQYELFNAENLPAGPLQTCSASGCGTTFTFNESAPNVAINMQTKGPPAMPYGGTIAAVNQSSNYFGVFLVRKAGATPPEPAEPPLPVRGPYIRELSPDMWIRADVQDGVTRTGNDVSEIADQTNIPSDPAEKWLGHQSGTAPALPQFDATGSDLGNLPVISTTLANGSYLQRANAVTANQPITIIDVWRPNDWHLGHRPFGSDAGDRCSLFMHPNGDNYELLSPGFGNPVVIPKGGWVITTRIYNGANSSLQVGAQAPVASPAAGSAGWLPAKPRISSDATSGVGASLTWAETVVFFRALPPEQVAGALQELSAYWGVSLGGPLALPAVVAVGDDGQGSRSTDQGSTWTDVSPASTEEMFDVTYGGGQFVAVGAFGTVWRSADGTQWTFPNLGGSGHLYAVRHCGGYFVAGGTSGYMGRSSDGISWTDVTPAAGYPHSTWDIACDNPAGGMTAVGAQGKVIVSTNAGLTWSSQTSPVTATLNAVASAGGTRLAVGTGATIIRSTNGTSWSQVSLAQMPPGVTTDISFGAVAFGNGKWVAIGNFGTYLVSSDGGATWTRITGSLADAGPGLADVQYLPQSSRFLAVGTQGKGWYSDAAAANWTQVTIDPGGSILWGLAFLQ